MATEEQVQEEVTSIVSVMGQALAQTKAENIEAGVRVLKAGINGGFYDQLAAEWERLKREARIKQGLNPKDMKNLYELLRFIDEDVPDEERLKAMKSIFFNSVTDKESDKDAQVAYQLMRLCRQLSSMEILILKACFELKDESGDRSKMGHGDWVDAVSRTIGYQLPELVSSVDDHLVDAGLIYKRTYADKSGINPGSTFRLTNLGLRLCEHITAFD